MLTPDNVERECFGNTLAIDTIYTLADALWDAVEALRDIATDQHRGWYVRRERAREALASIEAKVPKEWLYGGEQE